ncbi:hypothetical protein [Horticoccus sp. 23ND18S-11]|uniref:hypothetical protein n=1 Tax=Horticoccus sp. 23ND18S-11 TaxID=3391832 RepID=UPI0039C919BF
MRLRVNFEWRAGVCLWADDEAARARWTSAVTSAEAGLGEELAREADDLMARYDARFDPDNPGAGPDWPADEATRFLVDTTAWTERVRAVLAPAGIEVVALDDPPADATPPDPSLPHVEGEVIACFSDVAAREFADASWLADFRWHESATWQAVNLRYREDDATTPEALLGRLETLPDFVCGWWQGREGGNDAMLAGDPVEHAITCVRSANATGLANFLTWERVQRIHLGEALAAAAWQPTKMHKLADTGGSFWEWWSFLRNAESLLGGRGASDRYLAAERERLFWRWTHGGSRQGWPANFGEAFERCGLRRESFNRWVLPGPTEAPLKV